MKNIYKYQAILVIIMICGYSSAQDIHFSQFDASPIIINPSYTGMYTESDFRATNQYRSQWDALARKSYLSSILTYDMPFQEKWGLGAYIINDNSARVYNSFSFVLSGAHDIIIDDQERHKLSVGIQLGVIYKSTRLEDFLFDNQYSSGRFNEDLPTGEVFEKNARLMPETNIGVSYQNVENSKMFNPYGGISVFHILNPKENLTAADDSRLPLKFVLHGGSKISINDKITLDPKFLLMKQRNAYEIVIGAGSVFQIKDTDFNILGGINYRWNDAVITTVGLYYKNFIYRVSYDFNVSKLREFSSYKGGLEFSLVFLKLTRSSQRLL
ncbi:MAG: PorP/SprF family type IX secretion system membrane protein [Bacteroidota bacterium]